MYVWSGLALSGMSGFEPIYNNHAREGDDQEEEEEKKAEWGGTRTSRTAAATAQDADASGARDAAEEPGRQPNSAPGPTPTTEGQPARGPGSVRDPLREVDAWPVERRRTWAARALEIKATRGCSLDEAELEAARELGAGGDA